MGEGAPRSASLLRGRKLDVAYVRRKVIVEESCDRRYPPKVSRHGEDPFCREPAMLRT